MLVLNVGMFLIIVLTAFVIGYFVGKRKRAKMP